MCRREIDAFPARHIAQETRHLTPEQAGQVDDAVADYVGRAAWAQVLRILDAKIIEVDADRIAELAAQQQTMTGVWFDQANEHGNKTMYARGSAPELI